MLVYSAESGCSGAVKPGALGAKGVSLGSILTGPLHSGSVSETRLTTKPDVCG